MKKQYLTTLLVCGILMSASIADAAVLALDDFLIDPPSTGEYTGVTTPSTGSSSSSWLAGQNGGTGFTGNWVTGGNQVVVDSDTTMSVTGLSSPGGSAFSTFTSQLNPVRTLAPSVQTTLDSIDTLWFSSMITNDNASGTNGLELIADGGSAIRTAQRLGQFQFGLGATSSIVGTFTPGTTYLMVGRLDIDRTAAANETLSFWALTDIASFDINTPLGAVSADIISGANPGLSGIQLQKNEIGARYDAIRLTTTAFEALGIAIPEPSAFTLGVIGLLGICLLGRRRRR